VFLVAAFIASIFFFGLALFFAPRARSETPPAAAATQGAAPATAPVPAPPPSDIHEPPPDVRWQYSDTLDRITGKRMVRAVFMTTTFVRIPQRRPPEVGVKGGLEFRCDDKTTSVTIWIPNALMAGSSASVVYRIDDRAPVTTRSWRASTDYSALGIWDTRRAVAFAKTLFGAQTLAVRIHDTVFGTTEATFDLRHLPHRLRQVRTACRW
jgi:hypothetical protein